MVSDILKYVKWVLLGLAGALGISLGALWIWNSTRGNETSAQVVSSRLVETLPRQTLNTSEGLFSFIFPFDFFTPESPWGQALTTAYGALKDQGQVSPAHRELKAYYELAQRIGLSSKPKDEFLVFQVLAKAGVDLAQQAPVLDLVPSSGQGIPPRYRLVLPPVKITQVTFLEQTLEETQRWPDYHLSPGSWKELSDLLRPSVQVMILEKKMLEEAQAGVQEFFRGFLAAAGYEQGDIRFETAGTSQAPSPDNE